MQLIFEKSEKGRRGIKIPDSDVPQQKIEEKYLRTEKASLPEVSELDVVRHFTNLSRLNFCVDTHFYPLGSCTMKYNPKFTEEAAAMEGFTDLHPLFPQIYSGEKLVQGALEVIYRTERFLSEITGMDEFTLQPLAGAHGEFTGLLLINAYHRKKENKKKYVIVPDSSHGTNPASAGLLGYEVIVVPTDSQGYMDMEEFKNKLNLEVAAVMLTCPNTLGLFNPRIKEITDLAHSVDALVYYDGANFNAILGKCRPGDIGFDVVHLNLHKTFATPHGGGGPGSGPVGVNKKLSPFLPEPRLIKKEKGTFELKYNYKDSIGAVAPFYGNFMVILKAYAYILVLGKSGLMDVSDIAVLNANYCRSRLKQYYDFPYPKICMHECVCSALRQVKKDVHAVDIAKYLIDKGFHPPTIYFPISVKESIMIEPTETESKQTLDKFIEVMIEIARLAKSHPEKIKEAPLNTPVLRLDETKAARELNLKWEE